MHERFHRNGHHARLARRGRPIWKRAGDKWIPTGETAAGALRGNFLEVAIPRPLFPEPPDFHFKWAENPAGDAHVLDLEKGGDTAPNRRFLYHFNSSGR